MEISVSLEEGVKVSTHFDGFTVKTDQPVKSGGEGSYPDPFSYFLSSIAACAGFFVLRFCQSRDLPTSGIKIFMTNDWNKSGKVVENIKIDIQLPKNFPEKYRPAIIRTVDQCTVKRTILRQPEFSVIATIEE